VSTRADAMATGLLPALGPEAQGDLCAGVSAGCLCAIRGACTALSRLIALHAPSSSRLPPAWASPGTTNTIAFPAPSAGFVSVFLIYPLAVRAAGSSHRASVCGYFFRFLLLPAGFHKLDPEPFHHDGRGGDSGRAAACRAIHGAHMVENTAV